MKTEKEKKPLIDQNQKDAFRAAVLEVFTCNELSDFEKIERTLIGYIRSIKFEVIQRLWTPEGLQIITMNDLIKPVKSDV